MALHTLTGLPAGHRWLPPTLQDGEHAYIRLNFNFGGSYEPGLKHPRSIFLKELSFRSADVRHAAKVVQEIKALRSAVQQREKEKAERATLVQQEKLVRGKVRPSGCGRLQQEQQVAWLTGRGSWLWLHSSWSLVLYCCRLHSSCCRGCLATADVMASWCGWVPGRHAVHLASRLPCSCR